MANIPLTYKLSWYNPAYPGGQIHTQNDNMNHTTSASTQYTMQDIIDTVAFDAGSVESTGTPAIGWNARWTGAQTISGEYVPESRPGDAEIHKGYRSTMVWPTEYDSAGVWDTGTPIGNIDAWLTQSSSDFGNTYALDTNSQGGAYTAPFDFTNSPNRFSEQIIMGNNWLFSVCNNAATFLRENVMIIPGGSGLSHLAGKNCQSNVWIGSKMFDGDMDINTSSTVIIGNAAFENGIESTIQYGTYIGREVGADNYVDEDSKYNCHIGYRSSGNKVGGEQNVCVGSFTGQDKNTDVSTGNTMVGHNAGLEFTDGDYNTYIGWGSGPATNADSGGSNVTCIGNGAQVSGGTVSNEIVLGNASVTTLRCQTSTISGLSDQRDKKDIVDLDKGLDFVESLQPRKFVWDPREIEVKKHDVVEKEDGTTEDVRTVEMVKPATDGMKDIGFVAQELQAVDDDFLRLVYDANPDRLEVAYGRLVPVLVKAIQELSAKVTALENA